ncbi:hypothetical protein THAOC_34120 [Thalassiosira oceanica]|uniref:RxLR effector protein n=1 Tax=Thalassiosira oceanica TaxID=159749 RepID=K0R314_THAOC|nr:hypothetical protein THAOC_34120 [Thalassiosira oceanica]|eukprot:EJK47178.1 hypothetical protein THAOC_34120 [Thalassiosira oceanica]
MSRSVVVLLAMTVAALQLSTADAFVAPSSRVQRLSDTSRTFPMSDDEESSTLLADEATTMSLEDKMKSWEASDEEIRAASLGGVVPGGGGEPRTDAFDIVRALSRLERAEGTPDETDAIQQPQLPTINRNFPQHQSLDLHGLWRKADEYERKRSSKSLKIHHGPHLQAQRAGSRPCP